MILRKFILKAQAKKSIFSAGEKIIEIVKI